MPNDSFEKIKERLSKVKLFKDLTSEEMNRFVKIVNIRDFAENEEILREGEKGGELYIVYEGEVEVQKKTIYGDYYTCAVLSGGSNCFFGEVALLDNDVRSATIKSITPVSAFVIEHDDFMAFCNDNMVIGYKIMREISKLLCSRLRKADRDILTLFEALVEEIGTDKFL